MHFAPDCSAKMSLRMHPLPCTLSVLFHKKAYLRIFVMLALHASRLLPPNALACFKPGHFPVGVAFKPASFSCALLSSYCFRHCKMTSTMSSRGTGELSAFPRQLKATCISWQWFHPPSYKDDKMKLLGPYCFFVSCISTKVCEQALTTSYL